jgi:hypothetical protein
MEEENRKNKFFVQEDLHNKMIKVQGNVSLRDHFFMGDLDKYYKYGKFPYLFIIIILQIIILTTSVSKI